MSIDAHFEQFKAAAGEGALCELYLRLLAGKTPALEAIAVDARLEDVELGIVAEYAKYLDPGEVELLKRCRQLRNKLLHCDFREARQRLHALGAPRNTGGVVHVELGEARGVEVIETLLAAAAGRGSRAVAASGSTVEGSVMGWFLELGASGDMDSAIGVFRRVSDLVLRLAAITA